jgi:hypothetical protein
MELNLEVKDKMPLLQTENGNWGVRVLVGRLDIEVSNNYPVEKLSMLLERLVKEC